MLSGIVGFRIVIPSVEGKFKLSPNRPISDLQKVENAQTDGSADEQALASWMQRLMLY